MSEEEIISNIAEMLGTEKTYYPQGLVVKFSEKEKNTIINLLDRYLILKNKLSDSIPKSKIRDKILYYKSFGIHKVNNGLIGENFSEWTEYVMQDEIDILNDLLEEE